MDTKDAIEMSVDNKKLIELDKRIEKLEKTIQEFLDSWGPDVQRKRDERDERWDEMVRVLTIQKKHNRNK